MHCLSYIALLAAFIQITQGYCIYNAMAVEGSSISVVQHIDVIQGREFKKDIYPDHKECCHFSNLDCSIRGLDTDIARFLIRINIPERKPFGYQVRCYTGGALALRGGRSDYYAECTDKDGKTERVELFQYPF